MREAGSAVKGVSGGVGVGNGSWVVGCVGGGGDDSPRCSRDAEELPGINRENIRRMLLVVEWHDEDDMCFHVLPRAVA